MTSDSVQQRDAKNAGDPYQSSRSSIDVCRDNSGDSHHNDNFDEMSTTTRHRPQLFAPMDNTDKGRSTSVTPTNSSALHSVEVVGARRARVSLESTSSVPRSRSPVSVSVPARSRRAPQPAVVRVIHQSDSDESSASDVYASASEMRSLVPSPVDAGDRFYVHSAVNDPVHEVQVHSVTSTSGNNKYSTPRPYSTISANASYTRSRPRVLPRDAETTIANFSGRTSINPAAPAMAARHNKNPSIQVIQESVRNMRKLFDTELYELSSSSIDSIESDMSSTKHRNRQSILAPPSQDEVMYDRSYSSLSGRYRSNSLDDDTHSTRLRPHSSLLRREQDVPHSLSRTYSKRLEEILDSNYATTRVFPSQSRSHLSRYNTINTPVDRSTNSRTRARRLSNLERNSDISHSSSTASVKSARSPGLNGSSASPVYSDDLVQVDIPAQYNPDDMEELKTLLKTERSKYAASQQAYTTTLSALTTLTQTYFSEKADLRQENEQLSEALSRESRNTTKLKSVMRDFEEMSHNMQELMNLNKEYEQGYKEVVSKLEERESEMNALYDKNTAMRNEKNDLENDLTCLRQDLNTLQATYEHEKSEWTAKTKIDMDKVKADFRALLSEKDAIISATERERAETIEKYESALSERDNKLAEVEQRLNETNTKLEKEVAEFEKLATEHSDLKKVNEESLKEYDEIVVFLNKDHENLRDEHIMTSSQLATAQIEIESLQKRIADMQIEQETKRADFEAKDIELETLKRVLRGRMHSAPLPFANITPQTPPRKGTPSSSGRTTPTEINRTTPTYQTQLNIPRPRFASSPPNLLSTLNSVISKQTPFRLASRQSFLDESGSELELPSDLERELDGFGITSEPE